MKNQMLLGNSDRWSGHQIEDIKDWSTGKDEFVPRFKEMKKEIILWNKFAKQLKKSNPDITSDWTNIKRNSGSYNHINSFVWSIFLNLKKKKFELSQIGKIEIFDDNSRGSGKTFQMHLLDMDENIIDISTEYMDEYYYM